MAISFMQPRNDDTQQRLSWKIANLLYAGMGLAGVERVADTSAHPGDFWIFHAITDCVIAAIQYADGSTGAAAGDTLLAGDRIYGRITSLTLTSGTGELYRAAML